MKEKTKGIITAAVAIILFTIFLIFARLMTPEYRTVAKSIDVSNVCRNLSYYQKLGGSYEREITENNKTVDITYKINYINGIVVYSNWTSNQSAGIIILTGRDQIKNNDTNDTIAILTENESDINNFPVGTVVDLNETNWRYSYYNDSVYWFIKTFDNGLTKTGNITSNDPTYQDLQKAIIEYVKNARESHIAHTWLFFGPIMGPHIGGG